MRWVLSTLSTVALALTAGIPVASRTSGHLTNASISPGSASVTGTAADDVTAAAENTECYTEEGTCLCEVVYKVTSEALGLTTVTMSASVLAPALSVPSFGAIGEPHW